MKDRSRSAVPIWFLFVLCLQLTEHEHDLYEINYDIIFVRKLIKKMFRFPY